MVQAGHVTAVTGFCSSGMLLFVIQQGRVVSCAQEGLVAYCVEREAPL